MIFVKQAYYAVIPAWDLDYKETVAAIRAGRGIGRVVLLSELVSRTEGLGDYQGW